MVATLSCKQKGCQLATTGVCMENVKPAQKCPNLILRGASSAAATASVPPMVVSNPTSVVVSPVAKPSGAESALAQTAGLQRARVGAVAALKARAKPAVVSPVDLPSGDELSVVQAAELRRTVGGVLVALAGDQDVGKTTLIASLYDRFLDGPWAKFRFAGSETLVGFEKRLHLARMAGGQGKQDTPRTSNTSPLHFLHLSLVPVAAGNRQHLILADLSGERFREAADSQDSCRKELGHIKYADRLAVCLDGEKLTDLRARNAAISLVKGLLGNLLEVGHLDRTSVVDVLFTKWDLVLSDQKSDVHRAFIDKVEAMLRKEFAERLGSLTFFRVAARPDEKSGLGLCHQMDVVLSHWFEPQPTIPTPRLQFDEPADLRESERYLSRRLPQYVARKGK